MEQSKGKPVTTSVPSIAIKFHANAEELEELYASEDEASGAGAAASTAVSSEPESSPLKYLPRLVKRSTSIDITPATGSQASSQASSPQSDPWRFFSDIKGKITKSVEEKITEIKARNQEEGSPLKGKTTKDTKENNSSLSDSEDLSESSISKTCGIVSTTEGAEMSSDDDTPSIEKDRKPEPVTPKSGGNELRNRFRLLQSNSYTKKEGTIGTNALAKLYNINTERVEQALPEDGEYIESGVEVLEESNLRDSTDNREEVVLYCVDDRYHNIDVDANKVVNFKEVVGHELRQLTKPSTVFSPVGFVDMREKRQERSSGRLYIEIIAVLVMLAAYMLIKSFSSYGAGFIIGAFVTYVFFAVKRALETPSNSAIVIPNRSPTNEIVEIAAAKEHQPLTKYEGWVNEFPEVYNPHTYHISETQSVYLRLQGNLLRVSHCRSKIPKRALWNEAKIKPIFTHNRIYNLLGAKITLLPDGLAKKRHWSKKYPICVTLDKDQTNFDLATDFKFDDEEEDKPPLKTTIPPPVVPSKSQSKLRRTFGGFKKKKYAVMAQRFSKLTEEEEEFALDSDNSRASTPSPDLSDEPALLEEEQKLEDDELFDDADDDVGNLEDDLSVSNLLAHPTDESPTETRLYFFGRTDREKEDWFRRLSAATHHGANVPLNDVLDSPVSISDILVDNATTEADYLKYMLLFNKVLLYAGVGYPRANSPHNCKPPKRTASASEKKSDKGGLAEMPGENCADMVWINSLMGRILFDCLRDPKFTQRVKERIERKLAAIKLPYFIEGLLLTEISLGLTPPFFHRASKPLLDARGLWVDIDVTYQGLVVMMLQTKLNLMKLKHPNANSDKTPKDERPAMFHSDVDDSAESTTDDETPQLLANPAAPLDSAGLPIVGLGGTSNTSKKFIKMVDKIAESRFFQAATENRYIKKAMEGVSNTDLRLKVELRELVGTLVLNIPPPPSDRVWIGFRPTPSLLVSAHPIVGERDITFIRVTSWIEKKLLQEFQKVMVIPNMEDIMIPVMCPKLPE